MRAVKITSPAVASLCARARATSCKRPRVSASPPNISVASAAGSKVSVSMSCLAWLSASSETTHCATSTCITRRSRNNAHCSSRGSSAPTSIDICSARAPTSTACISSRVCLCASKFPVLGRRRASSHQPAEMSEITGGTRRLAKGAAAAREVPGVMSRITRSPSFSSDSRVARRWILPLVVLGMVFSLIATIRPAAMPTSLTTAASAARHTSAARSSFAARSSNTMTRISAPSAASTEKAATQPGRTSPGHASVIESSTSSG
mmetsp:Transcript_40873/g.80482  ORF Transcript_40873/g.80482 Transcript_40873/m.80482 type:complete len:263 (+) Transcript_40873:341-1129(+)